MVHDLKGRYLQIAFNYNTPFLNTILPKIPKNERIMIEVGTPFIKLEGAAAIQRTKRLWNGLVIADIKVADGAVQEVREVANAGADGATVLGTSSKQTIDIFINECKREGIISIIDMVHVKDPLNVLRTLKNQPDVVELHLGRDEENVWGKIIEYRHVRRIRSKYDVKISSAGGIGFKEAESAVFNGADIVVVNLVRSGDPWKGVMDSMDITASINKLLKILR
ncbi:orotidine 5'-phosphate decarboxylase [Candidatus Micrarchaeota archaeon]|nr:orotidine 5'-phosphate decarboxylase [Candidatus Micrarchaeota archaeon]